MTTPKHHVLIIGVGSIGERHLRCFQKSGQATVGLVETNEQLRRTIVERYGVKQAFTSIDAALASDVAPRFTAAVVCTPANLHVPMARQLVEAGLDVLVEKPLSTSEAGLTELCQRVKELQRTCTVAYTWRSMPAPAAMRQAIASGRFGKPLVLSVTGGQHFPTYRPAYASTYYARHETGGGCIQDMLTHLVNLGQWLVGPVTRVVADAAHQKLATTQVEDTASLITRHGDVLGTFTLNQHQAPNCITVTVVCERGTVQFSSTEQSWRWMTEPDTPWQSESFGAPERDTFYINQAVNFLKVVDGELENFCTLAEGWQTLRANLAALQSWREGKWVELAPVTA